MTTRLIQLLGPGLVGIFGSLHASDHADPLVLNPLRPPTMNEPRITDLHVFLDSDPTNLHPPTDEEGVLLDGDARQEAEQERRRTEPKALVLSLCVFPALPPVKGKKSIPDLDLDGYRYTIHLDIDADLDFDKKSGDLARYGGTIRAPASIASEITLAFELNNDATLKSHSFDGFKPSRTVISSHRKPNSEPGAINLYTGIRDDPFIFPNFFRTNVVAIVISIPLSDFRTDPQELLVWATTMKDGEQIDHVGRSQRTQLPRFDALNTLPPSEHVAEIRRRHRDPSILEDIQRTFISPLFAHRPYDAVPDVIIFSRSRPTKFPNGRLLTDDVGGILGATGETQIVETSYTTDPAYPRQNYNDRKFGDTFPYLAEPWTAKEADRKPLEFHLHRATLADGTWRMLWLLEVLAIVLLVLLLVRTVRSKYLRVAYVVVGIGAILLLLPVFARNLPDNDRSEHAMTQPGRKMIHLVLGGGAIGILSVAWIFALGWRRGAQSTLNDPRFPEGEQGITREDRQFAGTTYEEVHAAVFDDPYYEVWGGPGEKPLPHYKLRFATVAKGLLRGGRRFRFFQAQKRTLATRADLRWGTDGKGFRRLLHPNGICLAGEWKITESPGGIEYTGAFTPGTTAKIVARYSTCCTEVRACHWRSLSMAGKIFPPDAKDDTRVFPATFFTQEDLGGTTTESFRGAVLTNSPPVSIWRRGKGVFSFLLTIVTFLRADKMPSERQLYQIAELGKPDDEKTACPRFMRLRVAEGTPPAGGSESDFREEILATIYDRGEPRPKRTLVFDIEVSDKGRRVGKLVQRLKDQAWTKIGTIEFTEAAVSHNGDFVIHFPHPPWRDDRNDPATLSCPDYKRNATPPA